MLGDQNTNESCWMQMTRRFSLDKQQRNLKVWLSWIIRLNMESLRTGKRWKQYGAISSKTSKSTLRSILSFLLSHQTTRSATESKQHNCSLRPSMYLNFSSTLKQCFLYMLEGWRLVLYWMSVMVARMLVLSTKDFQSPMRLNELTWVAEILQNT